MSNKNACGEFVGKVVDLNLDNPVDDPACTSPETA
jgi:hypothetical protein